MPKGIRENFWTPPGVCRVLILGSQREQFTALNFLLVSHTCQYERMKVCKHYWGHMHITHTHFCTHTCSKFHTCACDCTQTPTCVLMCKKFFFKKSPPDFFQYSERTIGSTETNNSSKERSDAQFF